MRYYLECSGIGPGGLWITSGGHMIKGYSYSRESFLKYVRPGDTVQFGRYCPEGDREALQVVLPMEWTVLEKNGNRLLLLNRFQLFCTMVGYMQTPPDFVAGPFNYRYSYIRQRLAEGLGEWFLPEELALIEDTYLGADTNPVFGTSATPDVYDKLFLLTADEVLKYFDPEAYERRQSLADETELSAFKKEYYPMRDASADAPVVYAHAPSRSAPIANGAQLELTVSDFLGWWTRTPGSEDGDVALYESGGEFNLEGLDAGSDEVGVRPALWLNLAPTGESAAE